MDTQEPYTHLAQDLNRGLFDALARDPNARQHVRDAAEHVAASAEESTSVDEKLGLVQLPPIRISKANHELLSRIAESRGLIIQAVVRELLEPGEPIGWLRSGDGYAPVFIEQRDPPSPLTPGEAIESGWRPLFAAAPTATEAPAGSLSARLVAIADILKDCGRLITTSGRAERVIREAAAALSGAGSKPVQVWCDTCDGSGIVHQEGQRGVVGSGGDHPCPDCDGKGFNVIQYAKAAA